MDSKFLLFIYIFIFSFSLVFVDIIYSHENMCREIIFSDNPSADTLVKGRTYNIGTKQKKLYTGTYLGSDLVYYMLKTGDGKVYIKIEDVIIINEVESSVINKNKIIDSSYYDVELKDGNEINGFILSRDSVNITFKTKSNVVMVIPRIEIVQITKPKIYYIDGEFFIQDPNDSRLFLAPTARPIRKNYGFFSNVELIFPVVGFGIENIVSVVGGISLFPFSSTQLMYLNSKVTPFHSKYVDLAGGLIYFNGTSSSEGLTIGYAGGTFGTPRASLTTGVGVVFKKNVNQTPMIMLGGELRADNNIKFISENWIFTYKDAPAFSLMGVRVFGPQLAVDFALLKIWDKNMSTSGWPFIPYASFTFNLDFNDKISK